MKTPRVISVLLAAGGSTRMKSKTSKLLHSALGRPLIDWAMDQAGFISHSLVCVVGHQKDEIERCIQERKESSCEVRFAFQKEPKGTADAVRAALEILPKAAGNEEILFIMGADSMLLTKETVLNFLNDFLSKRAVLSLMTTRISEANAYGRILRNAQGGIERIIEAKECTPEELSIQEVNSGFYLIGLSSLREVLAEVSNQNRGREFYLTDLVEHCRKRGWLVSSYEISPEESHGVNTREDLSRVEEILRERINRYWMSQGVTFEDPRSIRIEAHVQLAADVSLGTGVQLKGATRVGEGTTVGSYSIVESSEIGPEVTIEPFSHIQESKISKACHIGPFARLRPGTHLGEQVHIGNFVEVKKSHLEDGVKANHHSYLGDATIGKRANIGAGTIICNYDGIEKHRSHIGADVFIGSNTSLVAPVEIGEGALVGAGSVITENIPSDALSIERAEQKIIPDGAKKFRDKKKKLK
jgi:bifunctional UDP-N-acetylglucosamine pyrophosphorylase/glucosamine-1-phosphate N-acetyltransferase